VESTLGLTMRLSCTIHACHPPRLVHCLSLRTHTGLFLLDVSERSLFVSHQPTATWNVSCLAVKKSCLAKLWRCVICLRKGVMVVHSHQWWHVAKAEFMAGGLSCVTPDFSAAFARRKAAKAALEARTRKAEAVTRVFAQSTPAEKGQGDSKRRGSVVKSRRRSTRRGSTRKGKASVMLRAAAKRARKAVQRNNKTTRTRQRRSSTGDVSIGPTSAAARKAVLGEVHVTPTSSNDNVAPTSVAPVPHDPVAMASSNTRLGMLTQQQRNAASRTVSCLKPRKRQRRASTGDVSIEALSTKLPTTDTGKGVPSTTTAECSDATRAGDGIEPVSGRQNRRRSSTQALDQVLLNLQSTLSSPTVGCVVEVSFDGGQHWGRVGTMYTEKPSPAPATFRPSGSRSTGDLHSTRDEAKESPVQPGRGLIPQAVPISSVTDALFRVYNSITLLRPKPMGVFVTGGCEVTIEAGAGCSFVDTGSLHVHISDSPVYEGDSPAVDLVIDGHLQSPGALTFEVPAWHRPGPVLVEVSFNGQQYHQCYTVLVMLSKPHLQSLSPAVVLNGSKGEVAVNCRDVVNTGELCAHLCGGTDELVISARIQDDFDISSPLVRFATTIGMVFDHQYDTGSRRRAVALESPADLDRLETLPDTHSFALREFHALQHRICALLKRHERVVVHFPLPEWPRAEVVTVRLGTENVPSQCNALSLCFVEAYDVRRTNVMAISTAGGTLLRLFVRNFTRSATMRVKFVPFSSLHPALSLSQTAAEEHVVDACASSSAEDAVECRTPVFPMSCLVWVHLSLAPDHWTRYSYPLVAYQPPVRATTSVYPTCTPITGGTRHVMTGVLSKPLARGVLTQLQLQHERRQTRSDVAVRPSGAGKRAARGKQGRRDRRRKHRRRPTYTSKFHSRSDGARSAGEGSDAWGNESAVAKRSDAEQQATSVLPGETVATLGFGAAGAFLYRVGNRGSVGVGLRQGVRPAHSSLVSSSPRKVKRKNSWSTLRSAARVLRAFSVQKSRTPVHRLSDTEAKPNNRGSSIRQSEDHDMLRLCPEMPVVDIQNSLHPALGPGPRVVMSEATAGNYPDVLHPAFALEDWRGSGQPVCIVLCAGSGCVLMFVCDFQTPVDAGSSSPAARDMNAIVRDGVRIGFAGKPAPRSAHDLQVGETIGCKWFFPELPAGTIEAVIAAEGAAFVRFRLCRSRFQRHVEQAESTASNTVDVSHPSSDEDKPPQNCPSGTSPANVGDVTVTCPMWVWSPSVDDAVGQHAGLRNKGQSLSRKKTSQGDSSSTSGDSSDSESPRNTTSLPRAAAMRKIVTEANGADVEQTTHSQPRSSAVKQLTSPKHPRQARRRSGGTFASGVRRRRRNSVGGEQLPTLSVQQGGSRLRRRAAAATPAAWWKRRDIKHSLSKARKKQRRRRRKRAVQVLTEPPSYEHLLSVSGRLHVGCLFGRVPGVDAFSRGFPDLRERRCVAVPSIVFDSPEFSTSGLYEVALVLNGQDEHVVGTVMAFSPPTNVTAKSTCTGCTKNVKLTGWGLEDLGSQVWVRAIRDRYEVVSTSSDSGAEAAVIFAGGVTPRMQQPPPRFKAGHASTAFSLAVSTLRVEDIPQHDHNNVPLGSQRKLVSFSQLTQLGKPSVAFQVSHAAQAVQQHEDVADGKGDDGGLTIDTINEEGSVGSTACTPKPVDGACAVGSDVELILHTHSRRTTIPRMNKHAHFHQAACHTLTAPDAWFEPLGPGEQYQQRRLDDTDVNGVAAYAPPHGSLPHMALVHVSVSLDAQHFHSIPKPLVIRHQAVLSSVSPKFVYAVGGTAMKLRGQHLAMSPVWDTTARDLHIPRKCTVLFRVRVEPSNNVIGTPYFHAVVLGTCDESGAEFVMPTYLPWMEGPAPAALIEREKGATSAFSLLCAIRAAKRAARRVIARRRTKQQAAANVDAREAKDRGTSALFMAALSPEARAAAVQKQQASKQQDVGNAAAGNREGSAPSDAALVAMMSGISRTSSQPVLDSQLLPGVKPSPNTSKVVNTTKMENVKAQIDMCMYPHDPWITCPGFVRIYKGMAFISALAPKSTSPNGGGLLFMFVRALARAVCMTTELLVVML